METAKILELLNAGHWLRAGARDLPEVSALLMKTADACHEFNLLKPSMTGRRENMLREMLGSVGDGVVINSPFRCDFGFNIHIGNNFVGNFNLCILDEAEVTIGDNVLIGPNCSLITITHALDRDQRNEGIMSAKPIVIGNNVWIASNVVVLPGVSIGDGAVIGAGSVVTKSIPAGMLAVGNPCRPLREITDADRVELLSE